jgi:hypothetical protein
MKLKEIFEKEKKEQLKKSIKDILNKYNKEKKDGISKRKLKKSISKRKLKKSISKRKLKKSKY